MLFFNKGNMVSEDCAVFKKDLYNLTCIDNLLYRMEIKKFSWDDKGLWKCMFSEQTKAIYLDIYGTSFLMKQ